MGKSMRQKMYDAAISGLMENFDKDIERLSANVSEKRKMYAVTKEPMHPFSTCVFCGTKDDVMQIDFGEAGQNIVSSFCVCPKCRKWFGGFLISGSKILTKEIGEDMEYEKSKTDDSLQTALEEFLHAFKDTYEYDECDEDYFNDDRIMEAVQAAMDDLEDGEQLSEQQMADVIKDTLHFIEYGPNTCDADDLEAINDDFHKRFPEGR